MNQKLTLSIEESAIESGKAFAKQNDVSLSSIVETFLINLEFTGSKECILVPVSNKLYSLLGISGDSYTEKDYKKHRLNKASI